MRPFHPHSIHSDRLPLRLPPGLRDRLECFFAADFSKVRLHTDTDLSALGAAACACGNDIYFAPGAYDPQCANGLAVLAHELTHVVQQRHMTDLARTNQPVVLDDAELEFEADCAALDFVSGKRRASKIYPKATKTNAFHKCGRVIQCTGTSAESYVRFKATVWGRLQGTNPELINEQLDPDDQQEDAVRQAAEDMNFIYGHGYVDDNPHGVVVADAMNSVEKWDSLSTIFRKILRDGTIQNLQSTTIQTDWIDDPVVNLTAADNALNTLYFEEMMATYYHFRFGGNPNYRISINATQAAVPAAFGQFLNDINHNHDLVKSFKVSSPGIFSKADSIILYVERLPGENDEAFAALQHTITAWQAGAAGRTRNWTAGMMNQIAPGVAMGADPHTPEYDGISFGALRTTAAYYAYLTLDEGFNQAALNTAIDQTFDLFGIDHAHPENNRAIAANDEQLDSFFALADLGGMRV